MRYGVKTCSDPIDPKLIYMRNMYHSFFWGGFKGVEAVIDAIAILDKADPMWDYDPFCLIYGSNPLPGNYVFGFRFVENAIRERVYASRSHNVKTLLGGK